MKELFVECIIAPGFSTEALAILTAKKNLRLVEMPDLQIEPEYELRSITRGVLTQDRSIMGIRRGRNGRWSRSGSRAKKNGPRCVLPGRPASTSNRMRSYLPAGTPRLELAAGSPTGWTACVSPSSAPDEQAQGAVMASDAFFPFADFVTVAAEAGITAVVHPGGSMRDAESIAAADAAGMAMVITGVRHFRH